MEKMNQGKTENRIRGKRNKASGANAEAIIGHRLRLMGFLCVQPIATGWRLHRAGGRIIGATPLAKVSGDFRAVLPGGRSVLIEVKRRASLRLSDFAPHNRKALTEHGEAGGLSLVAWVKPGQGVAFMVWGSILPGIAVPWPLAEACTQIVRDAVANQTPIAAKLAPCYDVTPQDPTA